MLYRRKKKLLGLFLLSTQRLTNCATKRAPQLRPAIPSIFVIALPSTFSFITVSTSIPGAFCGASCVQLSHSSSNIHRVPKKCATKLMAVTSSNLNRFSKNFYHWKESEISNKKHVSFPTTP